MFLLGLLLAACAGAFAALLIAYNTSGGPEYTVTMFDNDMVTLNSLAIFCAGLALGLIFALGLLMMGGKARISRAQRRRDRRAVDAAALERDNAEAREQAALARERAANAEARADGLEHERGVVTGTTDDAVWTSDPAAQPQTQTRTQAQAQAPTQPGGAHSTRWTEK